MINVQTNGSYTKIPMCIIEDFSLDAHMLVVLITLYRIKDEHSNLCQERNDTFANQSRCSKELVAHILKKLENKNYIQMTQSNQESFCLSILDKE